MIPVSPAALTRKAVVLLTGLLLLISASLVYSAHAAPAAKADTAPPATTPATPATVSADALPTVQINGVVWAEITVGNTVYAAGKFTSARPAGSPAGTNETPRGNLLAYDITTGNLITSFNHSLNAQALALAVSPDQTKLYVGGSFTQVDGINHSRIAEFNLSAGGALVAGFAPTPNAVVEALAATNSTVYAGGAFTAVGSTTRTRLAAFSSAGALLSWNPTADDYPVTAMVLTPDLSKVILGGNFTTINGATSPGLGAVDPTTGATLPWAAVGVVRDNGKNSGITTLSTDGNKIYGTGYVYTADGPNAGYLEGAFAADPDSGVIQVLEDCHGDTYGAFGVGQVFYTVSHDHYCGNIGAYPETNPRSYHHALAFTNYATGIVQHNASGNYTDWYGQPAPTQLAWYPTLTTGTYTGQSQAAWSITGNTKYIALGGEFPSVNGVAQQGLVRFAVSSIAPNKVGPSYSAALTPTVTSTQSGVVKISWTATSDPDNMALTYKLSRNGQTATPIYTTTVNSTFFNTPAMSYTDTGQKPGATVSYRVFAYDPFGNLTSTSGVSTTVSSYVPSAYANDVTGANPTDYWRLGDTSGTTGADNVGSLPLTEQAGITHGTAGAITGDTDTASTFDGSSSDGDAYTTTAVTGPQVFSEGIWFNTTTAGGKLIGFGNAETGDSTGYDRQIYMDDAGHLSFGVCASNGCPAALTTSGTYNDGQWHQVVGTLSSAGLVLYVDGKKIASNTGITTAQAFSGYWRLGGDNLNAWPNKSTNEYYTGALDEAAIYPTALTLAQIQQQYTDSGRTIVQPATPKDSYGKAVYALSPDSYLRLDETTGTTAADSSNNGAPGTYEGGVTLGVSSPVSGSTGSAVTLDGSTGVIVAQQAIAGPSVYSEDAWFKTTTTSGGKIMGFGNAASGESSSYDRHVVMWNDGQLMFGTYTGQLNEAVSPKSYNDGLWHNVVATQGPDGMTLYVDGQAVATNPQTQAQGYDGYWRVGGDHTWENTSSDFFAGTVDEASFFDSTELTAAQVASQYQASPAAVAAANQPPVAAFTATPTNLSVAFDGSGSSDPDGTIASYAWDFGDGSAAGTGVSPTHAYTAAGTYTVKLTVTDNQGATNTVSQAVTVAAANQPPVAAFTATPTNLSVAFDGSGSSDPDGTIASYAWDFGDGGSATTVSPTHAYAAAGTYTVKLTVTDNSGATNTVSQAVTVSAANQPPVAAFTATPTNLSVAFDGSGSSDPDGTIASYSWNYGDGSAAGTGVSPTHAYTAAGTYTVALTVTDNSGATNTVSHAVTVSAANQPPVAAFTATPTNLSVAFDGSGSSDPDGTVASYSWNFGDGSAAGTGVSPTHAYAAAGTYSVVLTVTDNKGGTGSVTHAVTVSAANQPPVAAFTATPTNLSVAFDGSGSSDPDGTVASYSWNFGDGSAAGTGATPTHAYAAAGTYSVVLTVTDNKGGTGSVTHSVTVTAVAANQPPVAAFTATPTNLSVAFDGSGSADPDGTVASYSWNFGDGSAAGTGVNPTHAYAAAGTYSVVLTVTDNKGATGTVTHSVAPRPAANAPAPTLASDAFNRTVASGLGTADVGGAWTVNSTANTSVSNGNAMLAMPATASTTSATLPGVSSTDTDTTVTYTTDKVGTGNGVYLKVVGRHVSSTNEYRGQLRLVGSKVLVALNELNNSSSETVIAAETTVPNLTYTPGTMLNVRLQVTGTNPTTVRIKVWASGSEPSAWLLSASDSASGLQKAGSVGLISYLAGNATNAPVVTSAANFAVHTTAAPPVAAFTPSCNGRACTVDASASTDPNNDITGYTWSWGDGTATTGVTSSHSFTAAGTYTVTLTVTDSTGRTSVTTQTVTVA